MRQPMTDRWIEATEARKVREWAMAERPPADAAAPSLMTALRGRLMLEATHLRLGSGRASPARGVAKRHGAADVVVAPSRVRGGSAV